jgi:purine-binding chemotaxis protein CheW
MDIVQYPDCDFGNGTHNTNISDGAPPMGQREMLEILDRRAARLAEALVEEETGEQANLLLIRLGREVYGLEAQYVDRVQPVDADRITRVPRVPNWVAGMVNLRGRVLSVIDLVKLFSLSRETSLSAPDDSVGGNESCLVVVSTPHMEVALLADNVLAVEPTPTAKIQEARETVRGLRPEYVRGVSECTRSLITSDGEDNPIVVVLDVPALLADERLVVHEEML